MIAELDARGYALWPSRLDRGELAELARLFGDWPEGRPGQRIDPARVARLGGVRRLCAAMVPVIGQGVRPVRAILFDKQDGGNWALGWHQDRTIEVVERREVPGFGPWTVKQGRVHVAPASGGAAGRRYAGFRTDLVSVVASSGGPGRCDGTPLTRGRLSARETSPKSRA